MVKHKSSTMSYPNFLENIINYHEPFVGGGSVLLTLLTSPKVTVNGTIYAYDINESLIAVYKHVQTSPSKLSTEIDKLVNEYKTCTGTVVNRKPTDTEEAETSKESYYYWIRSRYNTLTKHTPREIGNVYFFEQDVFSRYISRRTEWIQCPVR